MLYFEPFSVYPLLSFNQIQTSVALLPTELAHRVMKSEDPEERARRVGAYILLEKMVKKQTNDFKTQVEGMVKPEYGVIFDRRGVLPCVRYDSYGKPYFEGHENAAFSLSHSKYMVACAISLAPEGQAAPPVGVDIQMVSYDRLRAERVADRYFTDGEKLLLARVAADQEAYCRLFTQIWTKKEALLKCLGVGLPKIAEADSERPEKHGCRFAASRTQELEYTDLDGKKHNELYYLTVCEQANTPGAPM